VWTQEKYEDKIKNISRVLSEIGLENSNTPPALIGLCEIENLQVLEDLISHANLSGYNYEIIHYDSPDRRGVDVALSRNLAKAKRVALREECSVF